MTANPRGETENTSPPVSSANSPPSLALLLRVWLLVSIQSFGGGPVTLALIQRAVVEQHGWLTEAEFTRAWALVQLAPGINLLALTILIGRKARGAAGIAVSLCGLLFPSAFLAILITAFFARIQHSPLALAALHGLIPATVGLGLLTGLKIVRPLLAESRREGKSSVLVSGVLVVGSGLAVAWGHWPVFLVLLVAALIGAAMQKQGHRPPTEEESPSP